MNATATNAKQSYTRKRSAKWRALSFLMRTIGRTSSGIDLGYRYGFDSGVMLDKVYENKASGKYLVGTVIDWFYMQAVGWRAIRARKELLKRILTEQISEKTTRPGALELGTNKAGVVLADVAAGPGRYLLEMCRELRAEGRDIEKQVKITCRDLSPEAMRKGKSLAHEFGLSNFHYETGDAVSHASLETLTPRPDVVVVSGLYELFTDARLIKTSMAGIHRVLDKGGRLVFTTQVTHPQLEFIANVLVNRNGEPWEMVCRSIKEAEAFATEAGFRVLKSEMEPVGLFAVTVCEKE